MAGSNKPTAKEIMLARKEKLKKSSGGANKSIVDDKKEMIESLKNLEASVTGNTVVEESDAKGEYDAFIKKVRYYNPEIAKTGDVGFQIPAITLSLYSDLSRDIRSVTGIKIGAKELVSEALRAYFNLVIQNDDGYVKLLKEKKKNEKLKKDLGFNNI